MAELKVIAKIHTDFPTKVGIPRQSGMMTGLISEIVFEPEYRCDEALRGIEGFSHLWLIWNFSEAERDEWSPTVRPPRLGGNKRMGVFATRSPYRPNPIGLSSVKFEGLKKTKNGTVILVSGADLMDGTPIYDIKPYLAFTDSHPEAIGGFADKEFGYKLEVEFADGLLQKIAEDKRDGLKSLLSQDPSPSYIEDAERVYGFTFAEWEIKFTVADGILTVQDVQNIK